MVFIEPAGCCYHVPPFLAAHPQDAIGYRRVSVVANIHCDDRNIEFVQGAIEIKRADVLRNPI